MAVAENGAHRQPRPLGPDLLKGHGEHVGAPALGKDRQVTATGATTQQIVSGASGRAASSTAHRSGRPSQRPGRSRRVLEPTSTVLSVMAFSWKWPDGAGGSGQPGADEVDEVE